MSRLAAITVSAVVFAGFFAQPAQAQFTYISQTRTVYAAWYAPGSTTPIVEQTATSVVVGPWDVTAEAIAPVQPGGSIASQTSALSPGSMALTGVLDVTPGIGRSFSRSSLDVTFEASAPVQVRLTHGQVGFQTTLAFIALDANGVNIVRLQSRPLVEVSLSLVPGINYRFYSEFLIDSTHSSDGSMSGTLDVIPAPFSLSAVTTLSLSALARRRRPSGSSSCVAV